MVHLLQFFFSMKAEILVHMIFEKLYQNTENCENGISLKWQQIAPKKGRFLPKNDIANGAQVLPKIDWCSIFLIENEILDSVLSNKKKWLEKT